jgi:hypothetical protein
MSSSVLGFTAREVNETIKAMAEMQVVFQRRPLLGTDPEDHQLWGPWAEVERTLADGTTSIYTPCYFGPQSDPGEIPTTQADYDVNRYTLLIAYAPDILRTDRVTLVRHATTEEVLYGAETPTRGLNIVKSSHTAFVLSEFGLEEVL